MTEQGNYFAMVTLHAKELETWLDALMYEIGTKITDKNFKNKLLDLKDKVTVFNKLINRGIENKELHKETSANISKFCELLAKNTGEEGGKLIEAVSFLAKKSEVIFPDNKTDNDLLKKLGLISEINDKLIEFKPADLRKLHKQILNTPTKK